MPGQCSFKDSWLNDVDQNGHKLSLYIKKRDQKSVLCCACETVINIIRGCTSIYQHSKAEKHKMNFSVKLCNSQLTINCDKITFLNNKESVLRAEIIWALKCIQCNYSFQSNDGIKDIFRLMFDCDTAKEFSMSERK